LTFECFLDDVDLNELQLFAANGYLSFQDYAAAKWHHHIRAIIKTSTTERPADPESKVALRELGLGLEEFSSMYRKEIMQPLILSEAEEDCEPFKAYPFYANLVSVWQHVYQEDGKGPEAKKEIGIKVLGQTIMRNRDVLEVFASSSHSEDFTLFYGDKHFKCPRPTCFYFHEGFKDAKSREKHIKRHDRPYSCPFPDCSIVEFGFASNKDLEKHKKLFHPEISDQENSFNAQTKTTSATPWECNLCGKKFTRGFHMRSHLRSHAGERPFKCEECGRAFTRNNDKKRHEKLHARGR
jgi:hypothetical protein